MSYEFLFVNEVHLDNTPARLLRIFIETAVKKRSYQICIVHVKSWKWTAI